MNSMKNLWLFILAAWLPLPTLCFGGMTADDRRDHELQASFLKFKHLDSSNHLGEMEFQNLELDKSVHIGRQDYYGFRFTVPERSNHEDLVWAFIQPNESSFTDWYIISQTGDTDGFENYFYCRRTVFSGIADLLPRNEKWVITQRLAGDSLENGKQYLIWFSFKSGKVPDAISLEFKFADVPGKNPQKNWKALEKISGLQRVQPKADSADE